MNLILCSVFTLLSVFTLDLLCCDHLIPVTDRTEIASLIRRPTRALCPGHRTLPWMSANRLKLNTDKTDETAVCALQLHAPRLVAVIRHSN